MEPKLPQKPPFLSPLPLCEIWIFAFPHARWATSPVDTRPLGPYLNSWVDWSNVRKVPCSKKHSNTKVVLLGSKPGTFRTTWL